MPMRKGNEGEEMLVVAKAAKEAKVAVPGKAEASARRNPSLDQAEFEVARKRFLAAKDSRERKGILAEVQRKFGNDKAAELVRAKRDQAKDDAPSAKPKAPPKGKT